MAKQRKPKPGDSASEPEKPAKRYPSRDNVRYVAIPTALHQALEQYAKDKSDEDEEKSISWAARKAIRQFLVGEGRWPPKGG